jgi:hypothetical protein
MPDKFSKIAVIHAIAVIAKGIWAILSLTG